MHRYWNEAWNRSAIATRALVAAPIGFLLIVVPAISQAQEQQLPRQEEQEQPETLITMINGMPIQDFFDNRLAAGRVIEQLLGDSEVRRIRWREMEEDERREFVSGLLASLRDGPAFRGDVRNFPSALSGIGGYAIVPLLEAYADVTISLPPTITGKIRDYVFDEDDMSGHLAVDTTVTYLGRAACPLGYLPCPRLRTRPVIERLHWDIEVRPGTYRVIPHSGIYEDPFPNTVHFSKEKLADIKARGLNHKLFAQGPGIRVRHVYKIMDDGSIKRFHNNHPYYASTLDSCIDLMFAGKPRATHLPMQKYYCLGRCAQPAVVNSN
jgi:hypothetical protein